MKESIVFVHLPTGEKFEMDRDNENGKPLSDEDASGIRKLFSSYESIEFKARPDKNSGLLKNKIIILWGNVLKNCWVEIVNY